MEASQRADSTIDRNSGQGENSANSDQAPSQSRHGGYTLHRPDPKNFFPTELRRELLMDNGTVVLVGTRDLAKSWEGELFVGGEKSARAVRELEGNEKSPSFRPDPSIPEPGRLHPVCCATDAPVEVIDRFLSVNRKTCSDQEAAETFFAIADDTRKLHTGEAELRDAEESIVTRENSSFIGLAPRKCHLLLRHMRFKGSDINYNCFAMMDDRSLTDETILLVMVDPEHVLQTVRAAFEVAQINLKRIAMGDLDILELQRVAEGTDDAVLRKTAG